MGIKLFLLFYTETHDNIVDVSYDYICFPLVLEMDYYNLGFLELIEVLSAKMFLFKTSVLLEPKFVINT